MLTDSLKLARAYVKQAGAEIDALPVPRPLPYGILLEDPTLRTTLAAIGKDYYEQGRAAQATFILAAKGQYSFRTHARMTVATQIAFELFAREFAMQCTAEHAANCYSLRFDKTLPKRLYPERKATDRHRWLEFEKHKRRLVDRLGSGATEALSGLTTDLSRFFDNVRRDKLKQELDEHFPRSKGRTSSLMGFLHDIMQDRDGLPQASKSVFLFGDLLLLSADKRAGKGCEFLLRWADEYWFFDKHRSRVEATYRVALQSIGEIGLVFNDSKSKILNRDEASRDREEFKLIRTIYYSNVERLDPAAKCGMLCGMILERAIADRPRTLADKFLLNRLRQAFATDNVGAGSTCELVLSCFNESYRRSKDALSMWADILLMLPNRKSVFDAAYAAFVDGKYPLPSDRARLLDMMSVPEVARQTEKEIPTARLEKLIKGRNQCVTLRGSALRALYCRTQDIDLTLELATKHNEGDRLMREYMAATALLAPCEECKAVFDLLLAETIDEEEHATLSAFANLCHCSDHERRPLRFLPADPLILTMQLQLAVTRRY